MTRQDLIARRLELLLQDEPDLWLVADDTQTVEASVDARGKLRVLRLTPSWWRRVAPEELGSVVLRLRQASAVSRLHTVSELEEAGEVAMTLPEAPSGPLTGGGDEVHVSQLSSRLGSLVSAFSELEHYRRAITAATTESTVLKSPSGNVSLELVGGSPRRLTIDRMNVQFVSERELAAEIVALVARADEWLDERKHETLRDFPDLAGVVRAVRESDGAQSGGRR